MVQHPPGYYPASAAVLWIAGGGELRWDHASLLSRAVNAATLGLAIPLLAGSVRWVTGSRAAGLLGAFAALRVPFFVVMGGYVSNDTPLVTDCSATFYLIFRAWRGPAPPSWLLPAAGVTYGVALGTRGLALMMARVVVMLAVLAVRKTKRTMLGSVAALAVLAVVASAIRGWWWVRNLLVLGKLQPSQNGTREATGVMYPDYNLATFWGEAAVRRQRSRNGWS